MRSVRYDYSFRFDLQMNDYRFRKLGSLASWSAHVIKFPYKAYTNSNSMRYREHDINHS